MSAAATAIPFEVVAGAMDGHLRRYEREAGKVLRDFDTAVTCDTLNGATSLQA